MKKLLNSCNSVTIMRLNSWHQSIESCDSDTLCETRSKCVSLESWKIHTSHCYRIKVWKCDENVANNSIKRRRIILEDFPANMKASQIDWLEAWFNIWHLLFILFLSDLLINVVQIRYPPPRPRSIIQRRQVAPQTVLQCAHTGNTSSSLLLLILGTCPSIKGNTLTLSVMPALESSTLSPSDSQHSQCKWRSNQNNPIKLNHFSPPSSSNHNTGVNVCDPKPTLDVGAVTWILRRPLWAPRP